ncbi:MAG: hypothetical protein V1846_01505 [Candidatus Komeilibacteria bacterium]
MKHWLITISVLLALFIGGVGFTLAGNWQGPRTLPPDNGNVQIIGSRGADGLGDHHARQNVDMNEKYINNIGVRNDDYPTALVANSTGSAIAGSIIARGNANGISATSSSAILPTVEVKNTNTVTGGYALYASSTSNLAAYFGQYMQLAGKKAVIEFPGSNNLLYAGWQPTGVVQAGNHLFWGNNLLCDTTKLNCGWYSVGTGDNLGDHKARFDLNMQNSGVNFRIINVSNDVTNNNGVATGVRKISSLAATNKFAGSSAAVPAAFSSGAENYFGVYAQTTIPWNTAIQDISLSRLSGVPAFPIINVSFSSPVVFKDRVFWGSRIADVPGRNDNFLVSHSGLTPYTSTLSPGSQYFTKEINLAGSCADYVSRSLATFKNMLYDTLSDYYWNSPSRLLIYDGANYNCLTYSQLTLDSTSPMQEIDFNHIASLEVYRNKLFALSFGDSSASRYCRLLSYDGTVWKRELIVGSQDDCNGQSKLLAHGDKLYILAERNGTGGNLKFYTFNGSTLVNITGGYNIGGVGSGGNYDTGWTFVGDDLYVGSDDSGLWKYDGTNWTLVGSGAGSGPPHGITDVYYFDGKIYINNSDGTSYVWNSTTSNWDAFIVGERAAYYRGALISPSSALALTFAQPTAALGYGAGLGYGINANSVAGPGARLFGKTQIIDDRDVNVPAQLILNSDENRLSLQKATSTASNNLYWGDKLLCDATQANCGWAIGGSIASSFWQAVGNDTYADYLVSLGGQSAKPRQKLDLLVDTTSDIAITDGQLIVNANSVFVDDTYLYVSAHQGGAGNLLVYSLANPAQPSLVGKTVNSQGGTGLGVYGHYAYSANGTTALDVINVTNPASPQFVRTVTVGASAYGVVKTIASGSILYVLTSSGLYSFDISRPDNPLAISSIAQGGKDLFIQGKYAYVARDSSGFRIVDISNPAGLTLSGSYTVSSHQATKVIVRDKIAYVLFDSAIYALDVSNPASPTLIKTSAGLSQAKNMVLVGNYLYVTDSARMKIFSVEDPSSSIPEVGPASLFFLAQFVGDNIAVSGNYAYTFQSSLYDSLVTIRLPSARLQTLAAGSAAIDSAAISGQFSAGNLYSSSGLVVGGNLTVTGGPLIVGGSIKIGSTTLTNTTLVQLIDWLINH